MRREDEDVARRLLASCSALLCDYANRPLGTAFFVAPDYAITAAHVVAAEGLTVRLGEGTRNWDGRVTDVRPPRTGIAADMKTYPAPDLALIKIIDGGPAHACALLGRHLPVPGRGTWVMARGYTGTFDQGVVTAETETFQLTGTLETPDPGCTLLKLGQGEVTKGMSGAPVLELSTGQVIGMLRSSRQLHSNLGGWVVPAGVIRQLWPEEVGLGDLFHEKDGSWCRQGRQPREESKPQGEPAQGGLSGAAIIADVATVITGGEIGTIHIENRPDHARHRGPGTG